MNCFKFLGVICIFCIAGMLYAGSVYDGDIVTGTVQESYISPQTEVIEVPTGFDADAATAELKQARANGNTERGQELSNLLNAWWVQNADHSPTPMTHGSNSNAGLSYIEESRHQNSNPSLLWGTDVRIDPNNGVYGVKIASLSNGDLYAFSVWFDGSQYHTLVRRSLDNGETWSTYLDNAFASTTTILFPDIIADNDTLILSYILDHPASNEMRIWTIACLPGASYTPIYYGSPTGGFNPVDYTDLHLCTDAPIYGTGEYLYATWVEKYLTGTDSTRVMTAVSFENDVSAWETGPLRLEGTNGDNIYFDGTKTAFGSGSDRLWTVAWLHPNAYPTTYDRSIWGWYSDNYGSTWSAVTYITPYDNNLDEFDPSIAGSHSNTNWVVLATQVETLFVNDQDVNCWYSTDDGAGWTLEPWVTNSYENYLGDVWVDLNSTAFYGVLRQDVSTSEEYVRYKEGNITDPSSWSGSVAVNDDASLNLSSAYGPSVNYNEQMDEAIIAWNSYEGNVYSIWFDTYSGVGIEENSGYEPAAGFINLAPNPSNGIAKLSYVVKTEGNVNISVFDATGRSVSTLVNETKPAGEYTVNMNNPNLAAGVYFMRIETPEGTAGKTMTIVR